MAADDASNGFVALWRKAYRALGFQKGYNLPLFIIFGGAMLGFSLARVSYLNIGGDAPSSFKSHTAPGEWYWYRQGHYRVGITLHLGCIIPAGLLMVWQFIPAIRHKAILFHRINGYTIILLVVISNAGALMITRRAFGGTTATQSGVGILTIITTAAITMAYYNIKRLQIEQHRAWMLRAMFYLGTIITLRIILIISASVISTIGSYNTDMQCGEVEFMYGNATKAFHFLYPQCSDLNMGINGHVSVHANVDSVRPEESKASMKLTFGMAMWMSIFVHLVGVEIYLSLTPAEHERLRRVSYERQLEAGMKNPGSAGLTVDKWGDAVKWEKPVEQT